MNTIEIEYNGKTTTLPVTENLILFNVSPMPDNGCHMDLVEFDRKHGTKNIWYDGEKVVPDSQIHIRITYKDNIETAKPDRREPYRCSTQMTKAERFRLLEEDLKSEGWI